MRFIKSIYYLFSFVFFYLLKIIESNIYLAYDILTPRMHTNPGFIWVPVKLKSNIGILMFSNLLSMTPGTLSVDLSDDRKKLLVHYLYDNEQSVVFDEINKIQDKIMKLTQ